MAKSLVAYEVHTFQGGNWKIDSFFDDRQLAVATAERLRESDRYSAVRVVEESYDNETKESLTRVIFSKSKVDGNNVEARKRKAAVAREVADDDRIMKAAKLQREREKKLEKQKAERNRWLIGLSLKLVGIVVVGAGLLIGLRVLLDSL